MPRVEFEYADAATVYHACRKFPDGREMDRISAAMLPNVAAVPSIDLSPGRSNAVEWFVPVDDTHWVGFMVSVTDKPEALRALPMHNGKAWTQATEEERQGYPADFEAQSGQGPISLHSEEHLASSDKGVAMLRRLLTRAMARTTVGRPARSVGRSSTSSWSPWLWSRSPSRSTPFAIVGIWNTPTRTAHASSDHSHVSRTLAPPTVPPNWFQRIGGRKFCPGVQLRAQLLAFNLSLRRSSKAVP